MCDCQNELCPVGMTDNSPAPGAPPFPRSLREGGDFFADDRSSKDLAHSDKSPDTSEADNHVP